VLLGFSVVRFHGRTAVLAYEAVTGTTTAASRRWGMSQREAEALIVTRFLEDRGAAGERIFIWGYANDVYWKSGCRVAARFIAPYFVDGRFPDTEANPPDLTAAFWQESAARLLLDLRSSRPRIILDVEGNLRALPYRDLVDYVDTTYSREGAIRPDSARPFVVYTRRD
jgi:hypothetical protein